MIASTFSLPSNAVSIQDETPGSVELPKGISDVVAKYLLNFNEIQ